MASHAQRTVRHVSDLEQDIVSLIEHANAETRELLRQLELLGTAPSPWFRLGTAVETLIVPVWRRSANAAAVRAGKHGQLQQEAARCDCAACMRYQFDRPWLHTTML